MHPLVQSAIEAAHQGDKNKALGLLKQALTANPDDIEALLVLAGFLTQPDQKRQVLNRVLDVDPFNKSARDDLLNLDRQSMGTFRAGTDVSAVPHQPAMMPSTAAFDKMPEPPAPVASEAPAPARPQSQTPTLGKSITQPVAVKNTFTKWNWVEESPTMKPRAVAELDGSLIIEKPLVFKFPLFWRIVMYFFVAFFGCAGLLVASQNSANGLFFLALAALMGLTAMAFSPTVEVSDAGLRASGMFSSSEIRWDEIDGIKSVPMKRRLELFRKDGKVVNVSTQVSGYPRIVEIIRQRRPDLFGGAPGSSSIGYREASSSSAFAGTRTFHKNSFRQYGILLIAIPFCLFAVWTAATEPANRLGALIAAAFCGILTILPFFQVSAIKVEPDKLTIETMFEERVLRAHEVKDIKIQAVRGRYGRVIHFVNITPITGRNVPLQGFSDGDEIIYGILINWWEMYRDQ